MSHFLAMLSPVSSPSCAERSFLPLKLIVNLLKTNVPRHAALVVLQRSPNDSSASSLPLPPLFHLPHQRIPLSASPARHGKTTESLEPCGCSQFSVQTSELDRFVYNSF